MICQHCKKAITCGCQKATATDGNIVHKSCLHDYTLKLNITKNSKLLDKSNIAFTKLMNN